MSWGMMARALEVRLPWPGAKLTLLALAGRADDEGHVTPAGPLIEDMAASLAEETGLRERTTERDAPDLSVMDCLRILEFEQLLKLPARTSRGRRWSLTFDAYSRRVERETDRARKALESGMPGRPPVRERCPQSSSDGSWRDPRTALSEHDRLVLARAFDFTDSMERAMKDEVYEFLDDTLRKGVHAFLADPPADIEAFERRLEPLAMQCADMAVQGVLEAIQAGRLY